MPRGAQNHEECEILVAGRQAEEKEDEKARTPVVIARRPAAKGKVSGRAGRPGKSASLGREPPRTQHDTQFETGASSASSVIPQHRCFLLPKPRGDCANTRRLRVIQLSREESFDLANNGSDMIIRPALFSLPEDSAARGR